MNFFKHKEEKEEKEPKPVARQMPSFLSRANSSNFDMKRSLVVDSSYEHRLGQFPLREKKARQVSVDDFEKLKELGNGKYGRVYLVR